jgi:hypothetical protein
MGKIPRLDSSWTKKETFTVPLKRVETAAACCSNLRLRRRKRSYTILEDAPVASGPKALEGHC